jgi:hypothetical protein
MSHFQRSRRIRSRHSSILGGQYRQSRDLRITEAYQGSPISANCEGSQTAPIFDIESEIISENARSGKIAENQQLYASLSIEKSTTEAFDFVFQIPRLPLDSAFPMNRLQSGTTAVGNEV